MKKSAGILGVFKVKINVQPEIKQRLTFYFNEGLSAIAERGYDIPTARSHSCFAVCSQALTALLLRGIPQSSNDLKQAMVAIMEACDSMADEMRQTIYRKREAK